MTKKKPDFLRDLDTAIMDELTGGGINGKNVVFTWENKRDTMVA